MTSDRAYHALQERLFVGHGKVIPELRRKLPPDGSGKSAALRLAANVSVVDDVVEDVGWVKSSFSPDTACVGEVEPVRQNKLLDDAALAAGDRERLDELGGGG
jgi:hypothetical protein